MYPCKPQFYNIKVGFKGIYFKWTCFPDDGAFSRDLLDQKSKSPLLYNYAFPCTGRVYMIRSCFGIVT